MSTIGVIGIDHRSTGSGPVRFVVLNPRRLERELGRMAVDAAVDELVIVSTAALTEAYFVGPDSAAASLALGRALVDAARSVGVQPDAARRLHRSLRRREGHDAIRHLFRMAAGLESLVPGDAHVLGALGVAMRAGTVGPVLERLCTEALQAARRVRQCAGLGAGPAVLAELVEETVRRFVACPSPGPAAGEGWGEGPREQPAKGGRLRVIDGQPTALDVLVLRVVSPLDTGSIHGRGQGLLEQDPAVEVTFLLDQTDFQGLRTRMLRGEGEVRFSVPMNDVTAIDAARERDAPASPVGNGGRLRQAELP